MPHNTTSIYINNSPASFSQNLTAPSKIFKTLAPLQRSSFPLHQCTKNLNVNRYRKEIAPLEKTSGSALAQ